MQKIRFSTVINAPREKVWDTMLQDDTFRKWTSVFDHGSHFIGSWDKGSKILFLTEDKQEGMVSRIAENKPYEFISIKHLGIVQNGKEDTSSEAARKWTPAYENYTFQEKEGATEVLIDMDSNDEYVDMFNKTWPKALQKLKRLAEKT